MSFDYSYPKSEGDYEMEDSRYEKAKELHLGELSGTLVINVADIPSGMSIEEYLNFIQENNVVIMGL